MSKSSAPSVSALFRNAQSQGTLSPSSFQALSGVSLGSQIQAGLGVHVDDVLASEVVLLTIMPDDSGSIRFSGNSQVVRDGHNLVLDALQSSAQGEAILAHTRYLGGTVLFPYRPLEQAVRMDKQNYDPSQGTPLYDQTVVLLGSVIAKAQEFADAGVVARSVTLLITDGADEHSVRARAKDVRSLVKDMTATETHIVAAMGIDNGSTDFRRVFQEMGLDDRWILTPRSDPHSIREAFQVFSRSAIRASKAANFSQAALAGFSA